MSTAGKVIVEPTSPTSLSTVRTSSTDALLCLPPQRTIAYTKELSLPDASPPPNHSLVRTSRQPGPPTLRAARQWAARHADEKEYQTTRRSVARGGVLPGGDDRRLARVIIVAWPLGARASVALRRARGHR